MATPEILSKFNTDIENLFQFHKKQLFNRTCLGQEDKPATANDVKVFADIFSKFQFKSIELFKQLEAKSNDTSVSSAAYTTSESYAIMFRAFSDSLRF